MGRFFILGIFFFFINCQKSDERCGIIIQKIEINPQDFQFQNESVLLLDNSDGTMTIKEEMK